VIRLALIVVMTAAVLVVASENRDALVMAEVLFGFRTPPFSLGLLILLCFAAGAAAMGLWVVPAWLRASLLVRRQRREIAGLEEQVASGSAPPVAAPPTSGMPPHDVV
jgi:uncharacterized membrane protein YciS (DUF1049 family)